MQILVLSTRFASSKYLILQVFPRTPQAGHMSEIAPLLNKLGLQSRTDLRRAAEEILRTINRKVPIGTLQKAEVARPALAISCAFRQLGEDPPVRL
jgi:hypothetical protein